MFLCAGQSWIWDSRTAGAKRRQRWKSEWESLFEHVSLCLLFVIFVSMSIVHVPFFFIFREMLVCLENQGQR